MTQNSPTEVYERFTETYFLHQGARSILMMEAEVSSETSSGCFYHITWCQIPEDSTVYSYCSHNTVLWCMSFVAKGLKQTQID
jgi:hypothetical protein